MQDPKLLEGGVGDVSEKPNPRILLVDDDDMVRKSLKRLILRMGKDAAEEIAIESVASVEEAMQMIQDGLMPDVILSDMMMPGMTGGDFLEWLKKEHPALVSRFCFVSGGALSADLKILLEDMRKKGRMLDKPFDSDHVRNMVKSIIEGK